MKKHMSKKRLRRNIKNFLLKSISYIAGGTALLAGCCLDSDCWVLLLKIIGICFLWLFLFGLANGYMK